MADEKKAQPLRELLPAPADRPSRADAIRALGFEPERVKAVIVTETSVLAVSADYPEPAVLPDEKEEP